MDQRPQYGGAAAPPSDEHFAFSPERGRSDFALTTPDGRLVVFDTKLAAVKAEFVPTSHLAAAATAIAWKPPSPDDDPEQKSPKKYESYNFHIRIFIYQRFHLGVESGKVRLAALQTVTRRQTETCR